MKLDIIHTIFEMEIRFKISFIKILENLIFRQAVIHTEKMETLSYWTKRSQRKSLKSNNALGISNQTLILLKTRLSCLNEIKKFKGENQWSHTLCNRNLNKSFA